MVAELRGGRAWPSESGHLATSAPSPSSLYSETPPLLYTGDGGSQGPEKVPPSRAFSLLTAPISTFTIENQLLRHYAIGRLNIVSRREIGTFVHKDHNQWTALRIFANHINVINSRDRGTVSEWLLVPRYTTHSSRPHSADDQVIVMTTINIMHCSTAALQLCSSSGWQKQHSSWRL